MSGAAALVTISSYPNLSLETLSRVLRLSPAGATRLVDSLEDSGFVRRATTSGDRRRKALLLTKAGKVGAVRVLAARRAVLQRAAAQLSQSDRANLTRLIEPMLVALTPDRDTCDHTCRLCELDVCPQASCPIELAALRAEARE